MKGRKDSMQSTYLPKGKQIKTYNLHLVLLKECKSYEVSTLVVASLLLVVRPGAPSSVLAPNLCLVHNTACRPLN